MNMNNNLIFVLGVLLVLYLIVSIGSKDQEKFYVPDHLWKGDSMDYSSCYNSNAYCKDKTYRTPSGMISDKLFLQCGKPCTAQDDCPSLCPHCQDNVCIGKPYPE